MRRSASLVVGLIMLISACSGASGPQQTSSGSSTDVVEAEQPPPTAGVARSEPDAPTESQLPGGTRANPVPVGAVAQVGDWVIRVASVTTDGTDEVMAENPFNDPPGEGNQFFLVALEATYVGSESSNFWVEIGMKVVGESNVAYESFDAYCGVIPTSIDESGETFRGGTITGNACWNVSTADATSLVLITEESFSFNEDRVFFSVDSTAQPIDASTVTEGKAAVAEGGKGSRAEPIGLGESARVGNWEVRVMSVTPDGTDEVLAEDQFNDPPASGEQFYMVNLEASYAGEESSTFWIEMILKVVGESNVAYESFDAYCGVIPNPIDESGETFPGGTITGNACWKVASADVGSLLLIVEESFSFDETRVFFALS